MPDTPENKKFYLTTPIYYVNARPHIGHAYSTIAADVIARRHRLLGPPVGDDGFPPTFFLTGTDEHGQKVQRSAEKAGIPPQQFTNEVSATFRDLWARMGITNDDYIRTTDARHKRGVQKLWRDLEANGAIYLSTYTGQYSVGEEMFIDGPPGTIGPDGKPTETVTEENYFFRLSDFQQPVIDLIESNQLHIQPEAIRNEVLSFLRGGLKDLSISRTSFTWGIPVPPPDSGVPADSAMQQNGVILSEAKNPRISSLPLPVPPSQSHVIYVWLDALANYMTAIGYGSEEPADIAKFEKYWPADLHLVGKEITRFHCVYWPAFLLALNPKLHHAPNEPTPQLTPAEHAEWAAKWVPKSVVANGWLLFEESKMSKSRGNVVRTETILDTFGPLCPPVPHLLGDAPDSGPEGGRDNEGGSRGLQPSESTPEDAGALAPGLAPTNKAVILSEAKDPDTAGTTSTARTFLPPDPAVSTLPTKAQQDLFASDIIRYFLLREIPFGQDGSFSFDALITRYNADLANGYGNLVSRTLSMIHTYFGGVVPEIQVEQSEGPQESTIALRMTMLRATHSFENSYDFSNYLAQVNGLIAATDAYLTAEAPWKLAKRDDKQSSERLKRVLKIATESIFLVTACLDSFIPFSTGKVWVQLGLNQIKLQTLSGIQRGLPPGTKLGPLAPIFPRADKGLAQIMNDIETANSTPTDQPKSSGSIPTESFNDITPKPTSESSIPTINPEKSVPSVSSVLSSSPEPTSTIAIDDFIKVDLRVAQIVVAERIPKADKLLRLEVDLGPTLGRRQILSGIAEHYTPEELIGRRIAVIANLAPRKMRGLESHGMLLAASSDDHASKPLLATFSDDTPLGSRIR